MSLTDVVWFVITCTGWRYEWVLEDMDLIRLKQMTDYHHDSPPLHVMVRNYLGYGGKPKPKAVMEADDVAELARHAPLTSPAHLAVYKGGRIPKIGDTLWPATRST